jgi:holo-[acyl-carrier protein] synthase
VRPLPGWLTSYRIFKTGFNDSPSRSNDSHTCLDGLTQMIIGFGNDLCDIRRIEDSLARFGERFVKRCFTETERRKSDGRAGRAASYAKRFAAKEACAKALGTGFRAGVAFRDMGVVNLASGKPAMHLTGGAAARLEALTPPGHLVLIHLTLTDEYPLAQAQVIIEAVAIAAPIT